MALKTKQVPIKDLTPHPDNVNEGDVGAISQSLEYHGQYRAIVVSERTGHILAGNHTWMAASALGWDKITAHVLPDLTPEQELRIMVADNQYARLASTDTYGLADLLKGLTETPDGLAGVGFDNDDLDSLLRDLWPLKTFDHNEDGSYTRRIESPVYEPREEQPEVPALYDRTKTTALQKVIKAAKIPDDIAAFLNAAAERHTVFRYDRIADFYAHADKDTQALMEASALVIIDYDQAVEQGFVELSERTKEMFNTEYPDA